MGSIQVSQLGKAFKQYPHRFARLAEWLLPGNRPRHTLKWILEDISFNVEAGEAVGIIGLNGAGKSTLLKMITGITQPTRGSIQMQGRVAALLELGIGFHPDFTGRQNAFMSGQLLGLGMDEIARLMPEIEAFAEIGDYIDQPVRVYSSGMQMRLAFSVATAQRPDILIVDEALSVGDAYFQHKSFERIRSFQKHGTTLLIVSHDKQAIQSICDRAILLHAGRLFMQGEPEAVMDYYNAMLAEHQGQKVEQSNLAPGRIKTVSGTGEASLEEVSVLDSDDNELSLVAVGQPIKIKIVVSVNEDLDRLVLGFGIKDRLGQMMFGTNTYHTGQILTDLKKGERYVYTVFCLANLGVGSYSVHASLVRNHSHIEKNYQWIDGAYLFEVFNKDKFYFVGCSWNPMDFYIEKLGQPKDMKKNNVPETDCRGGFNRPGRMNSPLQVSLESGGYLSPNPKTLPSELDRALVIIDIGCRWGFAEKFIADEDLFRVYGFDPDIEECQRLKQRYPSDAVSIIALGLAGTSGKRKLYMTEEPACSSLLKPDPNLTENYPALRCAHHVASIEVETATLDDWAQQNAIQAIDYIKIDTQGSELEILQGGIEVLKQVRCLEVEVEFNPIYLGQPLFSDIDRFLRDKGFVLWKLTNPVHYSRDGSPDSPIGEDSIFYDDKQRLKHPIFAGQLYWANAHFIKKAVLEADSNSEAQRLRDIALFQAIGMPDVIHRLQDDSGSP